VIAAIIAGILVNCTLVNCFIGVCLFNWFGCRDALANIGKSDDDEVVTLPPDYQAQPLISPSKTTPEYVRESTKQITNVV
jgi:hypothetical protein